MLECNVISTLFAHYICPHGYIHFIYLFNSNTKNTNVQISQKIQRYVHIAQPNFEELYIW